MPAGLSPGAYAVVIQADYSGSVSETNESNNTFGFIINVAAPQLPDLVIEDVTVAGQLISQNELVTSSFAPGETFSVTYDVRNQGAGSAASSTAAVYLVVNGVATRMDTNSTTSLSAGSQDTNETLSFTVPANLVPGNYGVIIAADDGNVVVESGGSNNLLGFIINVAAPQLPDLVIEDVTVAGQSISQNELVTSSFAPGDIFTVTYDVLNQGAGGAGLSTAAVYLVVNGVATRMDTNSTLSLSAGSQDTSETLSFTVPANLAPGNYGVIIAADDGNVVVESGGSNNLLGFIINVGAQTDTVREGTDTAASLVVGAWQSGVINADPIAGDGVVFDSAGSPVDKDWYQVTLSEDRIYTFDGRSVSLSEGAVSISLYDQNGARITGIYGSGSTNYVEGVTPSFSFDTSAQTSSTQTYYLAVSAGGAEPDWRTAAGNFEVRFTDNGVVSTGPSNFTLSPATLNVGEGAGTANFTITRTNNVGSETVWVSTVRTEGSANIGDYRGQDTVAYTFANGVTSITVPIQIIDDLSPEANDTFAVWVQRNENDPFGTFEARSTFTIIDNDTGGAQPTFTLSSDATSVTENDTTITFTVTRSGTNLPLSTVYYSTLFGSASSLYGQDYEGAQSRPVVFQAGSNITTFSIDIFEDQIDENNETFDVMIGLTQNDGRSGAVAIRQITIIDDDTAVGIAPVVGNPTTTPTSVGSIGPGSNIFQFSNSGSNEFSISTNNSLSVSAWSLSSPNIVTTSVLQSVGGVVNVGVSGGGGGGGGGGSWIAQVTEISDSFALDSLVSEKSAEIAGLFADGSYSLAKILQIFNDLELVRAEYTGNEDFWKKVLPGLTEGIDDEVSSTFAISGSFMKGVSWGTFLLSQEFQDNPLRAIFVKFVDEIGEWAAGKGGQFAGGIIGAWFGGVGALPGALVGNISGGFLYNNDLNPFGPSPSDFVKGLAGDFYDTYVGGGSQSRSIDGIQVFSVLPTIDFTDILLDAEFYTAEHPEAVSAVASGQASNLLAYFIKFGIAAGHVANEIASPIDANAVARYIASFDPMSFGTPAVFSSASGVLAGDNISTDENALAGLVNAQRGAGGALVVDDELTALANRVARDWMDNNPDNALSAQNGGDPTAWIETLSTGDNFRNAFGNVNWTNLVLDTGVRVAGVISGAATAQEAYALFAATVAGAAFMADTNSRSIGVAEYAGLWIIVTSNVALQDDAIVDAAPVIAHQFGTDSAEVMFAGTGPGNAHLGGGFDAYFGGRFNDTVRGDDGDDQLYGGNGNDILLGGAGGDVLDGGLGNDRLNGGTGIDSMVGGTGNDLYYVDNAGDIIVETAGGGTADRVLASVSFALAADDDIELLTTTSSAGLTAINLIGNALAQAITGNAGVNVLNGGGGNDRLSGLAGADTFIFSTSLGTGNVDTITDFNVPDDTIHLDDAIFAGLTTGTLGGAAFAANLTGAATDALDRIIYETDTGRVYFDADGNGAIASVHFATLTANLAVTNADFFVF